MNCLSIEESDGAAPALHPSIVRRPQRVRDPP